MCNYNIQRQFRPFSKLDSFNFSVNIFDDGKILSLNVDAGAHGSHVAGIVAAFHPNDPDQNGIAPGAQIISLKIGDTRLGSMETGVGMIRALIECKNRGCNIINMSYGEATSWDNDGSIIKLADKIVNDHNICFVGSAGNNGPCLSTVGAPCGTSSSIISVGAFSAESLMKPGYSIIKNAKETNYTWSSVGPTLDGHIGVSIMAPGGAVTCIPNWCLAKNQLMNGTSMSAPNATGCIALLYSAVFGSGKNNIHPTLIRKAIENSAKFVENISPLGQGKGLIQVPESYEYIKLNIDKNFNNVRYDISLNSERFERGIYLRLPYESDHKNTYNVNVKPKFPDETESKIKINFEQRLILKSSESWINCPSFVDMVNAGKSFGIEIDPRSLSKNIVHIGFVKAYIDGQEDEAGCMFEIPITIIRPVVLEKGTKSIKLPLTSDDDDKIINLQEAERYSSFFVPPPGTTFIDVLVTDERKETDEADQRLLVVAGNQIRRGIPYRDNEIKKYIYLKNATKTNFSFSVLENTTLEFCVARYWSTLSNPQFKVELQFRGVNPELSNLSFHGGFRISDEFRIRSVNLDDAVLPTAKFNKITSVIKPIQMGTIVTLGERDILPNKCPLYSLILEYKFDISNIGEIKPIFPAMQKILYESYFHGQLFMIYDINTKKLIGTGDAFSGPINIKTIGSYIIRLQLRHENVNVIRSYSDMSCHLQKNLKSPITLATYRSQMHAAEGTNKITKVRNIIPGGSLGFYFKEPSADNLPKGYLPGEFLSGTLHCVKQNGNGLVTEKEPKGLPITYHLADITSISPKNKNDDDKKVDELDKKKSPKEEFSESIRDSQIKILKTWIDKDGFHDLFELCYKEYSDYLPLLLVRLSHEIKKAKEKPDSQYDVIKAADSIISVIDLTKLAIGLGTNCDKDDKDAVEERKKIDNEKSGLVDALISKAMAYIYKGIDDDNNNDDNDNIKSFNEIYKELIKWDELKLEKFWKISVWKNMIDNKLGNAIKRVNELLNSKSKDIEKSELLEFQSNLLDKLKWNHIKVRIDIWAKLSKKGTYLPF